MLLAEFSLTPLDKGASVGEVVARSLDVIDRAGIPYRLGPMGTCVEGGWDEVMAVLKACFERMAEDCERISISFKGDWRRGSSARMEAKIARVEQVLGRRLKT